MKETLLSYYLRHHSGIPIYRYNIDRNMLIAISKHKKRCVLILTSNKFLLWI